VAAAELVGLNSVDFLVAPDSWHLLEINPRPGSTMDAFEPVGGSLFALHVDACRGDLPSSPPRFADASGAAIVHAGRDVASVPAVAWPEWAADRQPPGTAVHTGAPLCTVLAEAFTPEEVRSLLASRTREILNLLGAG
jgi:predicted ATP-grasp superfamily ATP-dependent carboligase